jgi:glycosyltransferase involved in cell wall biosynthesis
MFANLRRGLLSIDGPAILFPFQINSNILAMGANRSLPKQRRLPSVLNDRACIDQLLDANARSSLSGRLLAPLRRRLTRAAYRAGDHVVCNARENEKAVVRFTGLDPSRVSTIYNPLAAHDIQRRFPGRDRQRLIHPGAPLFAVHGRMTEQKGLDSLLRAFAQVKETLPGARLRLVGDGADRASLEALAAELGVRSACEFPGFLGDPLAAIEDADLYVLPSRWEGLPNALLEAIALGLPVVATRCPTGPKEILQDGRVGRLVGVDDVPGLAKSMLELISNHAERSELARRARERALDFGLEINLTAYRAVFERLPGLGL